LQIAQFATYPSGPAKEDTAEPGSAVSGQPSYTNAEAAEIARCSDRLIRFAKTVVNEGTAEEKESIRNGTANLRAVAKQIRKRLALAQAEAEPGNTLM
jgi:hypothetical protein